MDKRKDKFTQKEQTGIDDLVGLLTVVIVSALLIGVALVAPMVMIVTLAIGIVIGGLSWFIVEMGAHVGIIALWDHRKRLWRKFRADNDDSYFKEHDDKEQSRQSFEDGCNTASDYIDKLGLEGDDQS